MRATKAEQGHEASDGQDLFVYDQQIVITDKKLAKSLKIVALIMALPGVIALLLLLSNLLTGAQLQTSQIVGGFITAAVFILFASIIGQLNYEYLLTLNARQLTKRRYFFGKLISSVQPLAVSDQVQLIKEVHSSSSSGSKSYATYNVKLNTAYQPTLLLMDLDYALARRKAEFIAKKLNFPLSDSCFGEAVIRQPDQLDEKIVDAFDTSIEPPQLPENSNILVNRYDDKLELQLPADWSVFWRGLFRAVIVLVALIIGSDVMSGFIESGLLDIWWLQLVIIVVLVVAVYKPIRSALSPFYWQPKVILQPSLIEVHSQVDKPAVKIVPADIEQLTLEHRRLLLLSDQGAAYIMVNSHEEDQQFSKAMVEYCVQFAK